MIKYTKKQIAELDNYYRHPSNLVDMFEDSVKKWGGNNAFGTKNALTKEYEWVTYREVAERINNIRGSLKKLGLKKGETVGVIVNNSVEWFVIENASHGLGARYVPMYEKELEKTWEYIIKDSDVKFLFVRDEAIAKIIKKFKKSLPKLKEIFTIYGDAKNSLKALEEAGKKTQAESYRPHWTEVAELIYTSGTTGEPKGVPLSHGNLTACSQSGYKIFPTLNEKSISLAILPWAHSYGLSAELHNFLQFGGAIGLMESVETLANDLVAVKPTFLIAVPRVFNKIYDGIRAKMNEEGGLKKKLFDAACAEAKKCREKNAGIKFKILDKLVFSKIRAKFGGKIEGVMTASALMNPDIAYFFKDIGIPTFDCYGLTETAPAITMNSPLKGNKYGSVGKPVENMFVKIDKSGEDKGSPDGEVLAYGAHVMMGYHNKPKQTAAMMTKDTWMGFPGIRTGDRGRLDDDGFLYITGRYKDEYKLSNGKYVHPESIETDMKLLSFVLNAMVHGDGKAFNTAVIAVDLAVLKKEADIAKAIKGDPKDALKNKELQMRLADKISNHLKKSFGGYEVPQKYIFTAEDFTLENGMLTQTMKIKRREVLSKYGKDLENLYK